MTVLALVWLLDRVDVLSGRIGRGAPAWMRGQSTVEYALVGALVVIAAAAALTVLSGQITAVFGNISNTLKSANGTH